MTATIKSLCNFIGVALFCCTLLVQAQPQPGSIALAKTVPIADVHLHNYEVYAGDFKKLMDRNNVQWAGAVGYLNDDMRAVL